MERLTPLFWSKSPEDTREFYQALGFEISYWQDTPYLYIALKRGAIELHFVKGRQKAMCLVHVPKVHDYHRAFADGLRAHYGRIPTADYPRITRLRAEQTRFVLFDPNGNELVFINQDEPDIDYDAYDDSLSPFMRVLENAAFVRDTYANDRAAAKLLDKKLIKQPKSALPIEWARMLAARAEIAVALSETERLQALRAELAEISATLSAAEREQFGAELSAADTLERWITGA